MDFSAAVFLHIPNCVFLPKKKVFFLGDLNYRIDLGREDVDRALHPCSSKCQRWKDSHQVCVQIASERLNTRFGGICYASGFLILLFMCSLWYVLPLVPDLCISPSSKPLDFDQLTRVRMLEAAFGGFHEGRVTFQPTYKLDRGRDSYDSRYSGNGGN